jgi:hypothetical protein
VDARRHPPVRRPPTGVEAAEDDRNAVVVSLMGEVGLEYVTYRASSSGSRCAQDLTAQRERST